MNQMPLFSAGQIARVTGRDPSAVRAALRDVKPDGLVRRAGLDREGFSLAALPVNLRADVEEIAEKGHFRSAEAALASAKPQWVPSVPMRSQPADAVDYAHRLRKVLLAHMQAARPEGWTREAARQYQATFGRPVTARHVARLAELVDGRDGGRLEWDRVELYLPFTADRAQENTAPAKEAAASGRFPHLEEAIQNTDSIANPSLSERAEIWRSAFIEFEDLTLEGVPHKKAKKAICDFLLAMVPGLAQGAEAVRKKFERNLLRVQTGGICAIRDLRRERTKAHPIELADARQTVPGLSPKAQKILARVKVDLLPDEWLLLYRAAFLGGGISQAFRELYLGVEAAGGETLQFSEAFRARYKFDIREAKSYVPTSLRNKIRPLLESIRPWKQGPKAARLAAPSISRDWSSVPAGAWYQSDDETANHYIYVPRPDGEFVYEGLRFDVLRPQILPLVDVRTDYILSVILVLSRQYTARDIRALVVKTCMDERIGLPFEGYYLERGIWEARNVKALSSWSDVGDGFARLGLSLRTINATTPKAKVIERIFSREQNSMQELPGYSGRDERKDCPERTREALALMCRVGQPRKAECPPWNFFMSAEQYLGELERVYTKFNSEAQNGKRLDGISPAEGWATLSGGRAHQVLPDSLRYLLASEQSEQKVGKDGVAVTFGKTKAFFMDSGPISALRGEQLIVRWNPELPDHVVCVHPKSDPQGKRPFLVQRAPEIAAIGASEEEHKAARSIQHGSMQAGRTIFRMLTHRHGSTVRNSLLGEPDLRAAGDAHNRMEGKAADAVETRKARAADAVHIARKLGIDASRVRRPDRIEGLADLDDLESRILAMEAKNK